MKLTLFVCFVLCCATLASAGKPWKRMRRKLSLFIKPYTDFCHVVSGYQGTTAEGFELTKEAAVLLTRAVDVLAPIGQYPNSSIGFVQFHWQYVPPDWQLVHAVYDPQIELFEYDKVEDNVNAIRGLEFLNGSSAAVEDGLFEARVMLHEYYDPARHQIAWLVTNEGTDIGNRAKNEASKMKKEGVKLFVVGINIGTKAKRKALRKLASRRCYFEFNSYEDYKNTVLRAVYRIYNL